MRRLSLVFAAVLAAFVFSEEASAQGVCFGSNCGSASGSGVPSNIPSGTPTDCTALSVWRTSAGQLLECGLGLTYSNGVIAAGTASTLRGGLDLFGATHAFSTRFQVSESQGAGITYTLPTTDGGASEFLQTNGSGALTWAAVSSTITSGTTATSGCVAGGVLYSISNFVKCDGTFTYDGTWFTVGNASTQNTILFNASKTAAYSGLRGGGATDAITLRSDQGNLAVIAAVNTATISLSASNTETQVTLGDNGTTTIFNNSAAATSTLVVNNGVSTGSPLVVQDNGINIVEVTDGADTSNSVLKVTNGSAAKEIACFYDNTTKGWCIEDGG
ncbi:MAG: hypothetical protein E6R03_08350, partial [Hyphomicrobiaceae bacterium]